MLKNVIKRLNDPFPNRDSLAISLRANCFTGIFIALFLFVFKPFGLHNVTENIFIICFQFGLVTFVFAASFELFTRFFLRLRTDLPTWTLWKWILFNMVVLCWIAFGNFLLMFFLYGSQAVSLDKGLVILRATVTLGILPVFVSGMIIQMRALSFNQTQAKSLSLPTGRSAEITSDIMRLSISADEYLEVSVKDILCVEAMQNYVLFHYIDESAYKTQLIRTTISRILVELSQENNDIIRCHRSYLVNVKAVKKVDGNAQGLKLSLKGVAVEGFFVPVSRTYMAEFKACF